jgi:ubiquinol-cytochrome c reductase cytochrome b subunit
MINSDTPKSWLASRLPCAPAWGARLTAPLLAREQPYLGALPAIITAALIFMALSGAVLRLFYNPADAWHSVQFIDRNVNYGWLIHTFHATGTTMIFGAVYLALFREIYIRSYKAPGELAWLLSIAQFSLLLLVGYLGYVMADGAVGFWSLASAANTASVLTGLPGGLGSWFFGGPAGPGTLARLAVFHAVLALAIFGIIFLYSAAKNAAAPAVTRNAVGFHPYYSAQYFAAFVVFCLIFAVLAFFAPHLGENPLNLAEGSSLLVPVVTTPPWYLLPVTALGHACPGVTGSIIATIAVLALLAALPWLDRSPAGKPPGFLWKLLTLILALDIFLLCLCAGAASTIAGIGVVVFALYFFLHFIVLIPLVTALETN